jgi:hypothetical protein
MSLNHDAELNVMPSTNKVEAMFAAPYGISGQTRLPFEMFVERGITCKLCSTCNPQQSLLFRGTMWSTSHLSSASDEAVTNVVAKLFSYSRLRFCRSDKLLTAFAA